MKPIKPIKLKAVEFLGGGYHLFVSCQLNGKRARLLVDTGASHTVIEKSFFKKTKSTAQATTGLHSSSVQTHYGKLEELKLGALAIPNFKVVAASLDHVNDNYKLMELPPIKGILGSDILMSYKCSIDFARLLLHVNKSDEV